MTDTDAITIDQYESRRAEYAQRISMLPLFGDALRRARHEDLLRTRCIEKRRNFIARCRPVRCVETGEVYISINDAAERHGCWPNAIRQSIEAGCAAAGKHWENA